MPGNTTQNETKLQKPRKYFVLKPSQLISFREKEVSISKNTEMFRLLNTKGCFKTFALRKKKANVFQHVYIFCNLNIK